MPSFVPVPLPIFLPRVALGMPGRRAVPIALVAALALAGCGGGGGTDAAKSPEVAKDLQLNGVVATGAALEGAIVSIQCAGQSGTATTLRDGSFSKTLAGAKQPCVLRASKGELTLHSVAQAGDGATATANITPLSEFITAQLAGAEAKTLFDTFDAAAQAKLTPDGLAKAIAAVGAIVKDAGVDLGTQDPIRAPLTAAHVDDKGVAQKGNDLDKKLDTLNAAIQAAGSTVVEMSQALAANTATPGVVRQLLKPAASGCAGLRSGRYRMLASDADTVAEAISLVTVDAVGLKYTDAGGETRGLAATDQACHYTAEGGNISIHVDKSGLGMAYRREPASLALLVPEQDVPLAELSGAWNTLGYEDIGRNLLGPKLGTVSFDANGKITAGAECRSSASDQCETWPDGLSATDVMVPDTAGGFTITDKEGAKSRVFAFKSARGVVSLLVVEVNAQGEPRGFTAAARPRALALPTVGAVTRSWSMEVNQSGTLTLSEPEYEVKSVDATAKTYTRARKSDGREDSFASNQPRDGLAYRAAATTTVGTRTVSLSDVTAMPLPGTGVSFSTGARPASGNVAAFSFFNVSIRKP